MVGNVRIKIFVLYSYNGAPIQLNFLQDGFNGGENISGGDSDSGISDTENPATPHSDITDDLLLMEVEEGDCYAQAQGYSCDAGKERFVFTSSPAIPVCCKLLQPK